ncbi:MAG: hypothetical protein GYB31_01705 [Bacteroidetes bacterium]|nr:hypothetical protein [Bacteroidota bacterium]
MKNRNSILLGCLVAGLFLFASCGKDKFKQDPEKLPNGTIICKADGDVYETAIGTAILTGNGGFSLNITGLASITDPRLLNIIATIPDGQMLDAISYTSADGQDCIPNPDICFLVSYADTNISEYGFDNGGTNGTATITFTTMEFEAGGQLAGTFSGYLVDDFGNTGAVEITEGKFNLTFAN